jgi:hypothetical protein
LSQSGFNVFFLLDELDKHMNPAIGIFILISFFLQLLCYSLGLGKAWEKIRRAVRHLCYEALYQDSTILT